MSGFYSDASIKVAGLRELQQFLDQFPPKMEAGIMRGAMRAGAVAIKAEIEPLVPERTGELKRGLKIRTRSRRGQVSASVFVGGKHAHLAYWFEYTGSAPHLIQPRKKGGKKFLFFGGRFHKVVHHPGTHPQPFMRPGLARGSRKALLAAGEYIKRRLAKAKNLSDLARDEVRGINVGGGEA